MGLPWSHSGSGQVAPRTPWGWSYSVEAGSGESDATPAYSERRDSVAKWTRGRGGPAVGASRRATSFRSRQTTGHRPMQPVKALAYIDVVGRPVVDDVVLLNVTALDLDLGTGGYALVAGLPDRLPSDPVGPGHLVKARYTPLQMTVLGVDEQDSPHHRLLRDADDLGGMPVVVADLHSALPAVIAGLRQITPEASVAYVATDGGALPLAFSRTVHGLRESGWLAGSITVGQTFGGDLEAVTVHNGLLAAHHVLEADVAIVVAQGPATWARAPDGGFRASPPARRSTPPRRSAAAPWRPSGCRRLTPASGTMGCRTTP